MKRWIKSALFLCLYYSGLEWLLAKVIPAHAVAVLMYHGVCDQAPIPAHINFHVERDVFERQMRALKRRYRVVPLRDVVGALKRGEPLKKAVVLTFDDGYKNNAMHAAPVLQNLGLPWTVFVATAYAGTTNWIPLNEVYWMWSQGRLSSEQMTELRSQLRGRPSSEARQIVNGGGNSSIRSAKAEESFGMLSWDDIGQMQGNGVEIGSHTHSHCNMTVENDEQQQTELRVSKDLLERNLQCEVRSFAYPYGYTSEVARRNVIQAGFECGLSTEYGLVTTDSDRFQLPRLGNDRRIWMFTGEILYQFAKQAARNARHRFMGSPADDAVARRAEERRG